MVNTVIKGVGKYYIGIHM